MVKGQCTHSQPYSCGKALIDRILNIHILKEAVTTVLACHREVWGAQEGNELKNFYFLMAIISVKKN